MKGPTLELTLTCEAWAEAPEALPELEQVLSYSELFTRVLSDSELNDASKMAVLSCTLAAYRAHASGGQVAPAIAEAFAGEMKRAHLGAAAPSAGGNC